MNRLVSMMPTIEILISSPLSGSEAAALCDFARLLTAPALILANFEISCNRAAHEIDFVVVTEKRAELIELKNITAPIRGGVNGPWRIETSPGLFVPYSGKNPWEQARDAKLALSDAMHEYAKARPAVPRPVRPRYYEQFDASVTIYPELMPRSQDCKGNYKAWVRSFPDTIQYLNLRSFPVQSSWGIPHWRDFAINYLSLVPASLSAAIDPAVFQAHRFVEEYAARMRATKIAPLLVAQDEELLGDNVVNKLKPPDNVLLIGRSGLGKSFHLEHYRRTSFESDEIPILLYARHYDRDLNQAIYRSIGPYTTKSPADLLEMANQLGKRPVLIVDAWNECPDSRREDLANALSAFQLRYNARVVAGSQTIPPQELFATFTKIQLGALREEHKRAIFAFHAGQQNQSIPPHWYELFSSAFDLTIAGRCQANGRVAGSRRELYESYIRSTVPTVSARAVLRTLAWHMGENFKPALSLTEYERVVAQFIEELGLNLSIADELLKSPILTTDADVIAFEHDLLRDYFRAEHLLAAVAPEQLPAKLNQPKYSELVEFVIPFLADKSVVQTCLLSSSRELLNEAFRGRLGSIAQQFVRAECQRLLVECRNTLPNINVEPYIVKHDDGRQSVASAYLEGSWCASDWGQKLCCVIATNLADDSIFDALLELLDLGEWALKVASERAGQSFDVKARAVLRELVDKEVDCYGDRREQVFFYLFHRICDNVELGQRHSDFLRLREALLKKVHEGAAGILPLLILMKGLRYDDSIDCADILAIARQAWDTRIANLPLHALDFIHSNAAAIQKLGPEAEASVVELLETFDVKDNWALSSIWVETRALFTGFDSGTDAEGAVKEFRQILLSAENGDDPAFQLEKEAEPNRTFEEFVGGWASGVLGRMFEDVFQGVYYEAYESLPTDERRRLLILALRKSEIGFFTDFYLTELGKFGYEGAEDALTRYGSRIDPKSFCPQDFVSCYILAHQAWATLADEPIPYGDDSSEDHRVWGIVGELIFWLNRKKEEPVGRISYLCSELVQFPKAVPGVLWQIEQSQWRMRPSGVLESLFARIGDAIRDVLHESLTFGESLSSVFPHVSSDSAQLFRWTISTLGRIGDHTSVRLLQQWTEDNKHGIEAIRAIEKIEQRHVSSRV